MSETKFCNARVEGPHSKYLWIDDNQKITCDNGTFEDPKPNAFSLVQIKDCPYATNVCKKGCYVHNLEKMAPEVHAKYLHNSIAIKEILNTDKGRDWASHLGSWINENCKGGFRWHVSGDIFSEDYANFIRMTVEKASEVNHWIYTRSYPFISCLKGLSNLSLLLSCDSENYQKMKAISDNSSEEYKLAYLTIDGTIPPDLPKNAIIFPDYSLRALDSAKLQENKWWKSLSLSEKKKVCPVDFFGKTDKIRCGPCNKCLIKVK